MVWLYNLDGASIKRGIEKSKPIFVALEEYRKDHNKFPEKLEDLVPEYLSRVPRPAWRFRYRYQVYENGQTYTIAHIIRGDADDWNCYTSDTKEWVVHDSSCQ
jgi:hypothetical protein